MSASFFSSFLVFAITGLVVILELFGISPITSITLVQDTSWLLDVEGWIQFALVIAIIFTAAYFYFFASLCEMDPEFARNLNKANSLEWVIRLFNQTAFMGIWVFMQTSAVFFGIYFILLYVSFLAWDFVTRKNFLTQSHNSNGNDSAQDEEMIQTNTSKTNLWTADWLGLSLAVALAFTLIYIGPDKEALMLQLLGIIAFLMMVHSFQAIKKGGELNKFTWWTLELWTKPLLK